jgi:hypothetical protein
MVLGSVELRQSPLAVISERVDGFRVDLVGFGQEVVVLALAQALGEPGALGVPLLDFGFKGLPLGCQGGRPCFLLGGQLGFQGAELRRAVAQVAA